MENFQLVLYSPIKNQFAYGELEEAFHSSMLRYSLRDLTSNGNVAQENIMNALQKALQSCSMEGINSRHHFKQIFIFDINVRTLHIDWLMSKNGVNLIVKQDPALQAMLY